MPAFTSLTCAHLRDIKLPFGACRLCQVQIEGRRGTITACSEPAADGMVVHSNTPEVNCLRREILEMMLARHPHECLTCWRKERCQPFDICLRNVAVTERCVTCPKNRHCELQKVADFIGLDDNAFPLYFQRTARRNGKSLHCAQQQSLYSLRSLYQSRPGDIGLRSYCLQSAGSQDLYRWCIR